MSNSFLFNYLESVPDMEQFSTENFPVIFQEECYNISWGIKHHGEFVIPKGGRFIYEQPWPWNFCVPEPSMETGQDIGNCYGYITPVKLFQNISNCKIMYDRTVELEGSSLLNRIDEIISKITRIKDFNYGLCDGSWVAQSVFIYREEKKVYERFTLKHTGNILIDHNSNEINDIIKKLDFDLEDKW